MVAEKNEIWPIHDDKPMKPLCQINLSNLECKPEILEGIEFITIFISDEDEIPMTESNGEGWLIRSYSDINNLVQLESLKYESNIKEFQLFSKSVEQDYPMWEDVSIELSEKIEEDYYDLFENKGGFKIGGWPSLIQGPIFSGLDSSNKTEFAFQIDGVSSYKANFANGDSGVMYFGLDKSNGELNWEMTWQCM